MLSTHVNTPRVSFSFRRLPTPLLVVMGKSRVLLPIPRPANWVSHQEAHIHNSRNAGTLLTQCEVQCILIHTSPPPMSIPPPPGTMVRPHPGGNRCQVTVPPPPGGIDTIANEQITAAYYAEFMTDLLLAVRRPRL